LYSYTNKLECGNHTKVKEDTINRVKIPPAEAGGGFKTEGNY